MKSVQKIDLGLTGYDELFMNDAERKENKLPRIYDIPLSEIDDFPDHPFKVKLDEDMDQLVQSIKERGIITPVTLRPKEDGRYEIVSGHRRKKACELAGFDTVKAEVRELTRDEAIILMVESNLQRSVILPSEKAFSYKMRLEAMNRQGQRTDLTCSPVGNKLPGVKSSTVMAEEVGESKNTIFRYIRLTELIPELLDLVDEGRIAFRPAVELSYLQKEEQSALLEQIAYVDATPSLAQAIKLKRFSQDGKLNNEVIESIMSEEKPNQREKINIKYAEARRFIFRRGMSGLLAVLMIFTALMGIGTTTAFAASTAGETAESYSVGFPRDGDANLDYSGTWGHDELHYMNGWTSGEATWMTTLHTIGSFDGQACYCIEPGVPRLLGKTYSHHGEDYWKNYPSDCNSTIDADTIKTLLGRIMQYGYQGNLSTSWRSQNDADADKLAHMMATQALVWETVVGERDANFNHVDPGSADAVKSVYRTSHPLYSRFSAYYDSIEDSVQKHTMRRSRMQRRVRKSTHGINSADG